MLYALKGHGPNRMPPGSYWPHLYFYILTCYEILHTYVLHMPYVVGGDL